MNINPILICTNESQFEVLISLYPVLSVSYDGLEAYLVPYEFVDDLLHNELDFIEANLKEI